MTTPKQNKELLGKGIRSLLQSIDADLKTSTGTLKPTVVENATGINRISVDEIEPNPKQPRRDFDEQSLKDLASSIQIHVLSINLPVDLALPIYLLADCFFADRSEQKW